MNRLAGFRTRNSDRVLFAQPVDMTGDDPSGWKEVIGPDQLVWVGHAPFESETARPQQPGEWGRIGPISPAAEATELASIPSGIPLSDEDASARGTIAANS